MDVPERWREYNCDDFFASPLAESGYQGEQGQLDRYRYIWSADRVYEDTERSFLVIGRAGVDGIVWGYRRGESGLWALYPIGEEFVWLAPTAGELLQGWISGKITV
jgi:hypothetical protein